MRNRKHNLEWLKRNNLLKEATLMAVEASTSTSSYTKMFVQ